MNKYGLEDRYLNFILNVLNENIKGKQTKYYIFGSRADGTYKEYSDIDIAAALNNNEKIDTSLLDKIRSELENSTLPYSVDIVDLNGIDENFRNNIQNKVIEL